MKEREPEGWYPTGFWRGPSITDEELQRAIATVMKNKKIIEQKPSKTNRPPIKET